MLFQKPGETRQRHMIKHYPNGYQMLQQGLDANSVWQDILGWIEKAPSIIR